MSERRPTQRRRPGSAGGAAAPPRNRYRRLAEPPCLVRRSRPAVRLFVERGLVVSEATRTDYADQTIFLDGAFDGPPFIDNQRRHYSMDHHAGCVRAFTLATCEQAAVMVAQGMPLDEGHWQLFINQPDLDALLAAWVLLNHDRLLRDEARLLHRAMPLLRLEGTIDAHGRDLEVLAGLSPKRLVRERARLAKLREPELAQRAAGQLDTGDVLSLAHVVLGRIDALLMPRGDEAPPLPAAVSSIGLPTRKLAVACHSAEGIYEVEAALRRDHPDAIAFIVLDRGGGNLTLLQVDRFFPNDLDDLYPVLNARDPNVTEDDATNHWGGSSEIGGSPRRTGSALTAQQVLEILAEQFGVDEVTAPD